MSVEVSSTSILPSRKENPTNSKKGKKRKKRKKKKKRRGLLWVLFLSL
jgi:hypothetical protein